MHQCAQCIVQVLLLCTELLSRSFFHYLIRMQLSSSCAVLRCAVLCCDVLWFYASSNALVLYEKTLLLLTHDILVGRQPKLRVLFGGWWKQEKRPPPEKLFYTNVDIPEESMQVLERCISSQHFNCSSIVCLYQASSTLFDSVSL